MTISTFQAEGIGAKLYSPQGPYGAAGQTPLPEFKPGFVVRGDAEGEFVFVLFRVLTAPITLNQGDVLGWDNSYDAIPLATGITTRGMAVGTFFCGGSFGNPAAIQGGAWSATFPTAGTYGIWVQRTGVSLINAASTAANANLINTTTTAKQIDAPGTPLVTSKAVIGAYIAPITGTFTGNLVAGSTLITGASTTQGLTIGQLLTGTGIGAGASIIDINASGIVMSVAATAAETGTTVTWANGTFLATTTSGSPTLTGISGLAGVYPNQTISGTGIPGSTTILAINGNPGNFTITLSANATAAGTGVTMTTNGYVEAYLRSAYIDKTN